MSLQENEYIGKINEDFGIKILVNKSMIIPQDLIGNKIQAKIIKANYKDNIITALFPI